MRRWFLVAGAFLFLAALCVLPAAAAESAGAAEWACAAPPVEAMTASTADPLAQTPLPFTFDTSCTMSSQCPSGQVCTCGLCHAACGQGQGWSCVCHICYHCKTGTFFDPSVCSCVPV